MNHPVCKQLLADSHCNMHVPHLDSLKYGTESLSLLEPVIGLIWVDAFKRVFKIFLLVGRITELLYYEIIPC